DLDATDAVFGSEQARGLRRDRLQRDVARKSELDELAHAFDQLAAPATGRPERERHARFGETQRARTTLFPRTSFLLARAERRLVRPRVVRARVLLLLRRVRAFFRFVLLRGIGDGGSVVLRIGARGRRFALRRRVAGLLVLLLLLFVLRVRIF